jgi:biotin carboxyl carrier protein
VRYEIEVEGKRRVVEIGGHQGRHDTAMPSVLTVAVDGKAWRVDAVRLDDYTLSLIVGQGDPLSAGRRAYDVSVAPTRGSSALAVRVGGVVLSAALDTKRYRRRAEDGGQSASGPQRLSAPMPGKIARVLVKPGEAIRARQPVVVIEAMKMENELRAGRDGTVSEIHTREGASVDAGALLIVIL